MNRQSLLVGLMGLSGVLADPALASPFQCAVPNGAETVSFAGLQSLPELQVQDQGVTYKFKPCGAIDETCGGKPNAMACEWLDSDPSDPGTAIGRTDPTPPSFKLLDAANPYAGFEMDFINGDDCSFGSTDYDTFTIPRTSSIKFVCDPTKTDVPTGFGLEEDNVLCTTKITLSTAIVCDERSAASSGGAAGEISQSWVFVNFVFMTAFIYFVLGGAYKTQRFGAQGIARLPHHTFWLDLPGLVSEGLDIVKGMAGMKVEKSGGHDSIPDMPDSDEE